MYFYPIIVGQFHIRVDNTLILLKTLHFATTTDHEPVQHVDNRVSPGVMEVNEYEHHDISRDQVELAHWMLSPRL